jgi:uncharacterized protein (TIGR02271 family)
MKEEDRERTSGEDIVVPVIEEEAEVAGVRPVRTGTVRVSKTVEKEVRKVDATLMRETVDVQHVPVNRVVNESPPIRREGDTVIVPVVEEELVITKRLVLKEEIHLIRRRTKERALSEVELNKERADVQRTDAEGRIVTRGRAEKGRRTG